MIPIPLPLRDARLCADVDEDMGRAARLAGDRLACRPGCTECCIGPFPITALDAWRLRRGLAALGARDPGRAAALVARAEQTVREMSPDFPGDAAAGVLSQDEDAREAFCTRHAARPCPVLDPATGHCELYEARPLSCRTFGPPVRIHHDDLPPCRLCFVGAPAADVESCRVSPRLGAEAEILADLAGGDEPPETVIAFALCEPPSPCRVA